MFPVEVGYVNADGLDVAENRPHGRSFWFDFDNCCFVVQGGQVAEADPLMAIKQWLTLLLKTTIDKYAVYQGSGFGTSIEQYIGFRQLPPGYVESELKRQVAEAASLNPYIVEVSGFKAERLPHGLLVTLSVVTENDVQEVSVVV